MGLGTDLIQFFKKSNARTDDSGRFVGRTLGEFTAASNPSEGVDHWRAAQLLAEKGYLTLITSGHGWPPETSRYLTLVDDAELERGCVIGSFDFVVGGLQEVRRRFERSVVQLVGKINGKPVSGSAFFVGSNATLLTAAHCVDRVDEIRVVDPSGDNLIELRTAPVPLRRDVAVLCIAPVENVVPLVLANDPRPLDRVLTMGYPSLAGLHPTLLTSTGEIAGSASTYLDQPATEYFVTTCAATGGSSGGPVVRDDGLVVGLVSAFSANDSGIDPGRFGLVAPVSHAVPYVASLIQAASDPQLAGKLHNELIRIRDNSGLEPD